MCMVRLPHLLHHHPSLPPGICIQTIHPKVEGRTGNIPGSMESHGTLAKGGHRNNGKTCWSHWNGIKWDTGDPRNRATRMHELANHRLNPLIRHPGQVEHLTVFQRTPNLATPMGQYRVSEQVQEHFKPVYEEIFRKLLTTSCGLPFDWIQRPMIQDSEKERQATFEGLWSRGGFHFWGR